MSGYRIDTEVKFLKDAAGNIVGVARDDGTEELFAGGGAPNSYAAAVVGAAGVSIAEADLLTTTGKTDLLYVVSDGENRGAKLVWAAPEGEPVATWCWWLWPQSAFEI